MKAVLKAIAGRARCLPSLLSVQRPASPADVSAGVRCYRPRTCWRSTGTPRGGHKKNFSRSFGQVAAAGPSERLRCAMAQEPRAETHAHRGSTRTGGAGTRPRQPTRHGGAGHAPPLGFNVDVDLVRTIEAPSTSRAETARVFSLRMTNWHSRKGLSSGLATPARRSGPEFV